MANVAVPALRSQAALEPMPMPTPLPAGRHRIVLTTDIDLEGFRREARRLLAAGVPPDAVEWHVAGAAEGDLFGAAAHDAAAGADTDPADAAGAAEPLAVEPADGAGSVNGRTPLVRVPAAFLALCTEVVLHRDPGRFGVLYRLLWRLAHEPALRSDPIDADRVRAAHLAQAVRRDLHKMKAFVRFRTIVLPRAQAAADADGGPPTLHVAWFEPGHHVVEAAAPFFARRFASVRWAILTPQRSVRWDGCRLEFGPGARRNQAPPADAGERLWLTYYAHIFNPARLKLAAMQKEMPRRYWPNLPEARLIAPLAAQAHERSARMVAQGGNVVRRRIPVVPGPAQVSRLETGTGSGPDGAADPPPRPFAGPDASPAERATAMAALRDAASRCRGCPLYRDATQAVWGEGPDSAPLMLVGEQPGDQEDLRGRPFVGPAGQLLDRALAALGWPRDALYLTNAVKHFRFELRGTRRIHKTAGQRDADACLHWLEAEIAAVEPRALVALGASAARQLLGRPVAVLREHGWHARADGRQVLVTLHPSALLRTPPALRDAATARWLDDLRTASALVGAAAA